jgi:hypothetical protein
VGPGGRGEADENAAGQVADHPKNHPRNYRFGAAGNACGVAIQSVGMQPSFTSGHHHIITGIFVVYGG